MTSRTFTNSLLKAFSPEVVDRLSLREVDFELNREIEFPGKPITHLYFVEEGMASQTVTLLDGSQVEVGSFGFESVVGVSALMGTKRSLNRVYTQIAGRGYSSPLRAAMREFALQGEFHDLALRYVQAQLVQAMQSSACNAKHDVEQRLCRWLLLCSDRAHSDTFLMPHEFLADMLGSTRPTVTHAAISLKKKGLIKYSRGKIALLDRPGLEAKTCECYSVIRNHLDNFAEFDSGITA